MFPSLTLPDDNSKLSISTRMIQQFVQTFGGGSNGANPATTTGLAPVQQLFQQLDQVAILSSVAFYQNKRSITMVNLSPVANIQQDPHINENIFSRFSGTDDITRFTDIGFSCDHDYSVPTNKSSFLTRCYLADWGIPPELSIIKYSWSYDQKTLQSNSTIDQTDVHVCMTNPLELQGRG